MSNNNLVVNNDEYNNVTIIDSICGSGKTSWAIQEMSNNYEQKYIYITPYLDEIERIKKECSVEFYSPSVRHGKGKKYNSFIELLKEGKNIASTHALFRTVGKDVAELIKKYDYTLILDEVLNVIEKNAIPKDDFILLKNANIIEVSEDGQINWIDDTYNGEFIKYKNSCLNGDMFVVMDQVILWTFPVSVFKNFKHIYIMTFLFEGQTQKYYYDMYNIRYEYKSVECVGSEGFGTCKKNIYELVDYKEADRTELKKLINIYEGRYNRIGSKTGKENPLSMSWYRKQKEDKTDKLERLRKNIEGYFKNNCKYELKNGNKKAYKSVYNLWTMPKEIAKNEKGNIIFKIPRNTKNFLSWNTRATNEYRHKINIAYCINLYMNVIDNKFFQSRGIKIDEDTWALGEMIQFIFRTQIRDGKPINIYIPSERMRNILIKWLDNK